MFPLTLINRLVAVNDAVTTFRSDPPDTRLVNALRRDRINPVDNLSGIDPATELQRSALASDRVGFDVLLLAFMAATAVLGFIRHHLMTLFAFATGVLLLSDAWFDVLTAKRGDFTVSVLTAVLAELPLAVVLIIGPLRIARLQVSPSSRPWWLFPPRRRVG